MPRKRRPVLSGLSVDSGLVKKRYVLKFLGYKESFWDARRERFLTAAEVKEIYTYPNRAPRHWAVSMTDSTYSTRTAVWDKKNERFLSKAEFKALTPEDKAEPFADVELTPAQIRGIE